MQAQKLTGTTGTTFVVTMNDVEALEIRDALAVVNEQWSIPQEIKSTVQALLFVLREVER